MIYLTLFNLENFVKSKNFGNFGTQNLIVERTYQQHLTNLRIFASQPLPNATFLDKNEKSENRLEDI